MHIDSVAASALRSLGDRAHLPGFFSSDRNDNTSGIMVTKDCGTVLKDFLVVNLHSWLLCQLFSVVPEPLVPNEA